MDAIELRKNITLPSWLLLISPICRGPEQTDKELDHHKINTAAAQGLRLIQTGQHHLPSRTAPRNRVYFARLPISKKCHPNTQELLQELTTLARRYAARQHAVVLWVVHLGARFLRLFYQ